MGSLMLQRWLGTVLLYCEAVQAGKGVAEIAQVIATIEAEHAAPQRF
jgi:hypothetical protein